MLIGTTRVAADEWPVLPPNRWLDQGARSVHWYQPRVPRHQRNGVLMVAIRSTPSRWVPRRRGMRCAARCPWIRPGSAGRLRRGAGERWRPVFRHRGSGIGDGACRRAGAGPRMACRSAAWIGALGRGGVGYQFVGFRSCREFVTCRIPAWMGMAGCGLPRQCWLHAGACERSRRRYLDGHGSDRLGHAGKGAPPAPGAPMENSARCGVSHGLRMQPAVAGRAGFDARAAILRAGAIRGYLLRASPQPSARDACCM